MNAPRGRILLVDDDPSLMRLLVLRLEAEGFEVVTAASGTEALQRLRGRPVELMISDLRMEGMDGIELARRFKGRLTLGIHIAAEIKHDACMGNIGGEQ